jgi:transposase-like protein
MSHEPQGGRKQLSGPEKLAILQAYLVEHTPISDLCDEHGLQPRAYFKTCNCYRSASSSVVTNVTCLVRKPRTLVW